MLQCLSIRNYAIIEQQEVAFARGLNIITGDTGAGKSILLGALALVLGQRAESKVLFDTSQKAIVEAHFGDYPPHLAALLEQMDLDVQPQIILRREILPSGKSRAFINDSPVRLDQLHRLTAELIDLHQQFESLEIQETAMQYRILDAYADLDEDLKHYQSVFQSFKFIEKQIASLQLQQSKAIQEKDYLEFQIQEFATIEIEPGKLEELESAFRLQEHAERIQGGLSTGIQTLTDDEMSVSSRLRDAAQHLQPYAADHQAIGQITERLNALQIESEDLSAEMQHQAESIVPDQSLMKEMEETIDHTRRLMIKHGVQTEEALIEVRDDIRAKLDSWEALDGELAEAIRQRSALEQEVISLAEQVSIKRRDAAPKLSKEITEMLHDLEMKNAQLTVEVSKASQPGSMGTDDVEFLFASNLGSANLPIRKVASGGELSRLSLCMKSVVSKKMQLPSLVFDEIDAGVSGQVALKMGRLLKTLSKDHQIIMITHSPQIASRASHHLKVSKRDTAERSIAEVHHLDIDSRISEIAKMLSGDPPTEAAVLNAKELINV